ncbi:MAG: hypothetical protein ABIR38_08505 [Chthoniobacterales bacterium]
MHLCTTAALIFSLTFPLLAAEGSEAKWKEYRNARFGFVLTYPPNLIGTREPENGGGREFHSGDGDFSVAASAHFLMRDDGDSLERRWQDELKSLGDTITYKKKSATWYVVSGVSKEGTEYYHKLYLKDSNWAAFQITYPHAKNARYEPWVARIAKSFVPFLEGDFDRL